MKAEEGPRSSIVGRGAADNPKNRFEKIEVEPELGGLDAEEPDSALWSEQKQLRKPELWRARLVGIAA